MEFESADDADKALKHMDGGQIDGQEITCELTHQPRTAISNGGGRRVLSPPRYVSFGWDLFSLRLEEVTLF